MNASEPALETIVSTSTPTPTPTPAAAAAIPRRENQAPRVGMQFIWVTAGKLAAAALQAITLILVARWLGPSRFGLLATALAVVVAGQSAADLGISTYVVRLRAQTATSPALRYALRISDRMSSTLSTVLAAAAAVLVVVHVPHAAALLLLAITAGADRNTDCWLGVLLADGDARINSGTLVVRRLSILAVLVTCSVFGMDALWSYCLATAICSCAATVFAHKYVARRLSREQVGSFRATFRETKHYWFTSIFSQLRNLDVVLITATVGALQAAYYAVAIRLTGPIGLVPISIAVVILPNAAKARFDRVAYRRVISFVVRGLLAASVIYLVMIALVPLLLPVFLGTDFTEAVPTVQIVVGGLCFCSAVALINALLNARGLSRQVATGAGLSTVLCLALILALGPKFGAVGGALAFTLSFAFNTLWVTCISIRHKLWVAETRIDPIEAAPNANGRAPSATARRRWLVGSIVRRVATSKHVPGGGS